MALPIEFFNHLKERGKAFKEPVKGNVTLNLSEELEKVLGPCGRLARSSKIMEEGEDIYWNACIFDKDKVQIWFGDLDLNAKHDDLTKFAEEHGKLYVTPEQPYRWDGLDEGRKQAYRENEVREFG